MRHPYIITYKESFMDKRCLCIVMDYADGGDLYTKIANQKKIGRGKCPRLGKQTYLPSVYALT